MLRAPLCVVVVVVVVVAAIGLLRCTSLGPVSEPPLPASLDVTSRAPASLPLGVTTVLPNDLFASPSDPDYNLTCDELFKMINADQPSKIQDVLESVTQRRPKYLSRVLYQYQTKMPFDDASWINPRLVTYGGDAKTLLTFGGHAHRPGYERLEALCFDDKQNEFSGYDIIFPAEAGTPHALDDLTEPERLQKFVIAKGGRGPRECTKCHQNPLRPNADTFALWPGFYGAVDDGLKDQDRPDMRPTYATYEYNNWLKFQSMPAKQGRYTYVHPDLRRPNSDFTLRVSYVNGQRIVGDLRRLGPKFEAQKIIFAQALLCAPKAPKKFFTQYDADAQISASFGVLPEDSDAITQDIFLASYYDEMQKERRIGELLANVGLPTPLPKEPFSALRLYYRDLLKQKDLNLDLRISAADVDEVLLARELKRVMDPLGVDIENWSMVRDGGYVFENGTGGPGRVALRMILERPFMAAFLSDKPELISAINAREAAENKAATSGTAGAAEPVGSTESVDQLNAKICGMLN